MAAGSATRESLGVYPPDEFIVGEARRNREPAIFVASIADCPSKIVGVSCS